MDMGRMCYRKKSLLLCIFLSTFSSFCIWSNEALCRNSQTCWQEKSKGICVVQLSKSWISTVDDAVKLTSLFVILGQRYLTYSRVTRITPQACTPQWTLTFWVNLTFLDCYQHNTMSNDLTKTKTKNILQIESTKLGDLIITAQACRPQWTLTFWVKDSILDCNQPNPMSNNPTKIEPN